MLRRLAGGVIVGALSLGALTARDGAALADEPPKAPPPAAPAPAAQQPVGAVVVATWDAAGPAAKALAFEVYRDADLRPTIDDATARVLAGEAAPDAAPARLKEIAELRTSIARAYATLAAPVSMGNPVGVPQTPPATPPVAAPAPAAPSDLVVRRLLASLGTELRAALVITVGMDGSRPVARVLRPQTAAFERVELGPTVDIGADGARTYRWPGTTTTLRGFISMGNPAGVPQAPPGVPGSAVTPPSTPAPLAPKAEKSAAPQVPTEPRPFYKSPWFWGSVGGAVAIGLSVFLISRATSSSSDVHVSGKVGP